MIPQIIFFPVCTIFTVAGHAEQKPQCHNPCVERRWRDLGISHVQLIGTQIVRRGGIGRTPEKTSKVLDRSNMGFLRLVTHPVNTHIFDHPLTQRRHLLMCHGNLLSID